MPRCAARMRIAHSIANVTRVFEPVFIVAVETRVHLCLSLVGPVLKTNIRGLAYPQRKLNQHMAVATASRLGLQPLMNRAMLSLPNAIRMPVRRSVNQGISVLETLTTPWSRFDKSSVVVFAELHVIHRRHAAR